MTNPPGKPFTEEEARLLWTGAQVERMHCVSIAEEWGRRHAVSGSAFDELLGLIRGRKNPVTGKALEADADARVRDAAPELLEACRAALEALLPREPEHRATVAALEGAIAKATGEGT